MEGLTCSSSELEPDPSWGSRLIAPLVRRCFNEPETEPIGTLTGPRSLDDVHTTSRSRLLDLDANVILAGLDT
jgi:hypothetical protein